MWMSHRPKKEMFSKVGMVISTTAGTGTISTIKTMKKALKFMGVKRIFSYGVAVSASNWQEVNSNKNRKIEK